MKIVVTGASGLLGRSLVKEATSRGWDVLGLAFSRAGPGLEKVDITDHEQVRAVLERVRPDFVVHAAAQRFPDKVESEYDKTRQLNVTASGNLAAVTKSVGGRLLYISTDYVFDGVSPPFTVADTPRPLNKYGLTKLDGERAVTAADPESVVLRVPVLYGPVERLDESAVTVLLRLLQDPATPVTVSHYEKRYPAHVQAVADIICQLLDKLKQKSTTACVFQWSGLEQLTKYDMCVAMAEVFSLTHAHITPDSTPPSAGAAASRPYDSRMDNSLLESIGVTAHRPFREAIRDTLKEFLS